MLGNTSIGRRSCYASTYHPASAEEPSRRPCRVLTGGLPGTGKSTIARGLVDLAGFQLVRSDVVRKELAGLPAEQPAPAAFGEGIYDSVSTERTYNECLSRAKRLLFDGKRVVVDASFGEERRRCQFLELSQRLAAPAIFFLCEANPDIARLRLERRQGDASDADWPIHQRAAERWEKIGRSTQLVLKTVATDGTPQETCARARDVLRDLSLLE